MKNKNKIKIINKIKPFSKTLNIEGDKSISIRWALLASQAYGKSKSMNLLKSDDIMSTLKCLKKLGVKIRRIKKKEYLIYGKGLGSLYAKNNTELDFGNS